MNQATETRNAQETFGGSGRLHVALDTAFSGMPPSGIGRYVEGLITAFAELPTEITITPVQPGPLLARFGSRAKRMIWDAGGIELARRRKAANADLLHVPAFSAPIHTAAPLVVTVHDVIPLVLSEYRRSRAMRVYLEVMKRTVGRADLVLTPSAAAAHDIVEVLCIPPERIRITPLAADRSLCPSDNPERTRTELEALDIREPYLLSMAGFDRRKNVPLLVRAFARAVPHIPDDTRLVLAGAPHSANSVVYPPVEPIIAELGLEGRVTLTGRVTDTQRRSLYQGAKVYCTPSEYEGFGLTPLEAMSCGVPVIAVNRTSLPEVVDAGGLLVEPDVDALADSIVRVVTDESIRTSLSRAGLERSRSFSWERTARATIAAYKEVIAG